MKDVFVCKDCDSTYISVEAIVIQGEDGELEVTSVCDDGHTCNECGSDNIGTKAIR